MTVLPRCWTLTLAINEPGCAFSCFNGEVTIDETVANDCSLASFSRFSFCCHVSPVDVGVLGVGNGVVPPVLDFRNWLVLPPTGGVPAALIGDAAAAANDADAEGVVEAVAVVGGGGVEGVGVCASYPRTAATGVGGTAAAAAAVSSSI